jgi:dihydrolipoamide dehydrogenase
VLPGLKPDGKVILSSEEALTLEELPSSIIIVGGGVIGVEWASMLVDFGVQVTVVEAAGQLLPMEDEEIARELLRLLKKRGVKVLIGTTVDAETCAVTEDGVTIEARKGEQSQTNEPHIYGIGDCIGGLQLAHAASHEGIRAVNHLAGEKLHPYHTHLVPRCVYTRPEVASVGYTEKEAKNLGHDVVTGKFPFSAIGKAIVYGMKDGFVKVVADRSSGDILGVQMIGPHVTDLIGEAALAQLLDATPWEVGEAIHAHPTLSEIIGEAMLAVDGKSIGF